MTPEVLPNDVTIYRGDCLSVMRSLPDASFDLVITSPPYNLGTTAGGGFADVRKYAGMKMGKWGGGSLAYGYGTHDDAMPHEDYVAWQKECLTEMWRLLTPTGAVF